MDKKGLTSAIRDTGVGRGRRSLGCVPVCRAGLKLSGFSLCSLSEPFPREPHMQLWFDVEQKKHGQMTSHPSSLIYSGSLPWGMGQTANQGCCCQDPRHGQQWLLLPSTVWLCSLAAAGSGSIHGTDLSQAASQQQRFQPASCWLPDVTWCLAGGKASCKHHFGNLPLSPGVCARVTAIFSVDS